MLHLEENTKTHTDPWVITRQAVYSKTFFCSHYMFSVVACGALIIVSTIFLFSVFSGLLPPNMLHTPVIIRDPTVGLLFGFTITRDIVLDDHNGYSIADALENAITYTVPLPPDARAVQFSAPLSHIIIPATTKLIGLEGCLDFQKYLPAGYCFIFVNVTTKNVVFNLAWWRSAWTLTIATK